MLWSWPVSSVKVISLKRMAFMLTFGWCSHIATTTTFPLARTAPSAVSKADWTPAQSKTTSAPMLFVALKVSATTLATDGSKTEDAPWINASFWRIAAGSEIPIQDAPRALYRMSEVFHDARGSEYTLAPWAGASQSKEDQWINASYTRQQHTDQRTGPAPMINTLLPSLKADLLTECHTILKGSIIAAMSTYSYNTNQPRIAGGRKASQTHRGHC